MGLKDFVVQPEIKLLMFLWIFGVFGYLLVICIIMEAWSRYFAKSDDDPDGIIVAFAALGWPISGPLYLTFFVFYHIVTYLFNYGEVLVKAYLKSYKEKHGQTPEVIICCDREPDGSGKCPIHHR